jgi:translation initiation factor 2 beta subunit (eIF-2beta)/eIF-5
MVRFHALHDSRRYTIPLWPMLGPTHPDPHMPCTVYGDDETPRAVVLWGEAGEPILQDRFHLSLRYPTNPVLPPCVWRSSSARASQARRCSTNGSPRAARANALPPNCCLSMAASHLWVNVDGSDDPGYRYRMPRAEVGMERRGTLLKNCGEIAKALHRPPQYLAKFCGLLLGCHSEFDEEQRAAVIRGEHLPATVHGLVRKFVDGWVLCGRCKLPETRLEVGRSKVTFDCKACGARRGASAEHKLTAFIVGVCHTGLEPRTSRLRAHATALQCTQTGLLLTRLSLALDRIRPTKSASPSSDHRHAAAAAAVAAAARVAAARWARRPARANGGGSAWRGGRRRRGRKPGSVGRQDSRGPRRRRRRRRWTVERRMERVGRRATWRLSRRRPPRRGGVARAACCVAMRRTRPRRSLGLG